MAFNTNMGTFCQHEEQAIPEIVKIIKNFSPRLVIEFGTKYGGFTSILQSATSDETEIYSYDNIKRKTNDRFRKNVYFITADILSEPVQEIITLCKGGERKLLYCDNGNKIREFQLYALHLRMGDLLGVHDWGTEIFYDSVSDVLKDFTPRDHKIFEASGWKTRFWIKGA